MTRSAIASYETRIGKGPRRVSLMTAILLLSGLADYGVLAQLPTTKLSTVFPPGGNPGKTLVVSISGADLDEVDALMFSQEGISARPKTSTATQFMPAATLENQFLVTIADEVPDGIYEVRAVGRFGASNPRAFQVGGFHEIRDDGSSNQFESAKQIKLGSVVSGRVSDSSRAYYIVTMKRGQRILVDCFAERIDSRMDATLILMDAVGRQLVSNRDMAGRDPLLDFTAPIHGEFVIGIHDAVYRGGSEYFYRLHVHSGPHVDFVFPPVGQVESKGKYTMYGRNLPGGRPDATVLLDGVTLEKRIIELDLGSKDECRDKRVTPCRVPLRAAMVDGMDCEIPLDRAVAKRVTMGFAQAPLIVEQPLNDVAGQAQRVTTPCEYVGQFYPVGDIDWLQFDARNGEIYRIDVISHRLGIESDPYLLVQQVNIDDNGNENIQEITQQDDGGDRNRRIGSDYDTSTDDPTYRFQVPRDGTYRIAVRDQFNTRRVDPRRVYRLVIRPERPDFQLLVVPALVTNLDNKNPNEVNLTSAVVRAGGSALLNVTVHRHDGFDGEIEIEVEGLPEGVTCPTALVGGRVDFATLVVSASEKAGTWAGPIRVVGRAKVKGNDVSRHARSGSLVWDIKDRQRDPPQYRLTKDLVLAVVNKELAVAQVQAGDDQIWETTPGGRIEVPVNIRRRGDFKADVKLAAHGLPKDFRTKGVTVKKEATVGTLVIDVNNKKIQPGTYTFCLRSEVKFKYSRNQDAIAKATDEQKRLDQLLNDVTTKAKQATDRQRAAGQLAQDGERQLMRAEQDRREARSQLQEASPDEIQAAEERFAATQLAFTRAQQDAKAMSEAKNAAAKAAFDAQQKVKAVTSLKQTADRRLNDVTIQNEPTERTIAIYSTPIKIRVVHAVPEKTD